MKNEPFSDEAYDDGVVIDGSYPENEVCMITIDKKVPSLSSHYLNVAKYKYLSTFIGISLLVGQHIGLACRFFMSRPCDQCCWVESCKMSAMLCHTRYLNKPQLLKQWIFLSLSVDCPCKLVTQSARRFYTYISNIIPE